MLRISFNIIIFVLGLIVFANGTDIVKPQLSREIPTAYYIEATLDTAADILSGSETIFFQNPTNQEIKRYILHLYPNAFADTTTLMARSIPLLRDAIAANPGYIECDSVAVDGSNPDSVITDETLLYIYPEFSLKPGRTARIQLKFTLKIPAAIRRFGKNDQGNYLFAHWHPIMVGYQKNKPVVYQYGSEGEFFSNFSDYEMKLQIPDGFKLISTANINQPDSTSDGNAYYTLQARRVIDFAFACGATWEVETFYYQNISINILYDKKNAERLEAIKNCINESIAYFNKLLFPYPYANLSYVDFNPGAGGMELPRLIAMPFKRGGFGYDKERLNTLVHETAHQWFYAVVATNEFDEAWLDEGMVTYLTDRAMIDIYGDASMLNFYGISATYTELSVFVSRFFPSSNPLSTPSDKYYRDNYYNIVYGRGAATFRTLQGVHGDEVFDKALKDYAVKYKYGHPDIEDLKNSFETSADRDLSWFFNNYVYGTARVDYEVAAISIKPTDSSFVSTVEVRRNYDGVLPQDIVVGFADGTTESRHWDGIAKYEMLKFEYAKTATWAAIDTAGYYLLDEDFANNSFSTAPDTGRMLAITEAGAFLLQLLLIIGGML
jgi:hypothetical protein